MFACFVFVCAHQAHLYACLCVSGCPCFPATAERKGCRGVCLHGAAGSGRRDTPIFFFFSLLLPTADRTIQTVICSIKNSSALRASAAAAAAAGHIQLARMCLVCVWEGITGWENHTHTHATHTCLQVVTCEGRRAIFPECRHFCLCA